MVGKGTKATARVSGNAGISRTHVRIYEQDGAYFVEDLGSTNGTYVGDERLAPGEAHELASGEALRLADEDFDFTVE